jgi:hypothetical protein
LPLTPYTQCELRQFRRLGPARLQISTHFDSLIAGGQSPRIDSAITDAQGQVKLSYSSSILSRNLLAQLPGYAGLVKGNDSVVQLGVSGSLSGSTLATTGSKIFLDGSGLWATVDSDKTYHFQNIPQGFYALLLASDHAQTQFAGAVIIDTVEQVFDIQSDDGFLLEDFDDGNSSPLIAAFGAGGKWYLYDEMAGTSFEPSGIDSQIILGISATDAWKGKSLGLSIHLDSFATAPYGSLACKLGPDSGQGRADLSELDSVSFWVKGSGQFRLVFASDYIHTKYPIEEAGADLGYVFRAPAQWTRMVIPVDSLQPPSGSQPQLDGIQWHDVASSIDLLVIGSWDSPGLTIEIRLDDIRLHGVSHPTFR